MSADGDRLTGRDRDAVAWSAMPAAGSVVIFTASKALAGLSLGSVKPKSAAPKV